MSHEGACLHVAGQVTKPPTPATTASSGSESNDTLKTVEPQDPGASAMDGRPERARTDAGGQGLTTNQGVPGSHSQHSLKGWLHGPALLEDGILCEKITHFDHERIPERIIHARGSGAHGFFEAGKSLRRITRAAPLRLRLQGARLTPGWSAAAVMPAKEGRSS